MTKDSESNKGLARAIGWVPSLYFVQGLPFIMINVVSVAFYKRMEIDNTEIALYTSLLYLPWVVKPFWSPFVDVIRTKRLWILTMQALMALGFAGVALVLPMESFFRYSLALFWLLAFASATHDIAADGFYMLGLRQNLQAGLVGIRNLFFRIAMITGQGGMVVLAGRLEKQMPIADAWQIVFYTMAGVLGLAAAYHVIMLPRVETPPAAGSGARRPAGEILREAGEVLVSFFRKEKIGLILAFLLLYRFGEAQLVKIAQPFLLDTRDVGGLGLDTEVVGYIYGTIGVAGLIVGGILGGLAAALKGLKFWLWPMLVAINLPNVLYVFLATVQPESELVVSACVAVEQFGYGFGFTAYMLYLIYTADGPYKTAHYALGTGFMALGMMIPGLPSGWIQEQLGYAKFFVWVCIATVPAFVVAYHLPLDPEFGKKRT